MKPKEESGAMPSSSPQGSPDISADNIPSAINQSDRTPIPDSEAPTVAKHGGPDKADDAPRDPDGPYDPYGFNPPYDPYGPFAPDSHGDCCRGCNDEEFLEHEAEHWERNRDRERNREAAWIKRIEKYFDKRIPFPLIHPQFLGIQGVPIKTAKYQVIICFSFGISVLKGIYTTDDFSPESAAKRLCGDFDCTVLYIGSPEPMAVFVRHEDEEQYKNAIRKGFLAVEKVWF